MLERTVGFVGPAEGLVRNELKRARDGYAIGRCVQVGASRPPVTSVTDSAVRRTGCLFKSVPAVRRFLSPVRFPRHRVV